MKLCILLLAIGVLVAPLARGDELLTNGDFEEVLTTGWTQEVDGGVIYRNTHYHPDEDFEVFLQKTTGSGYARLSQTVEVPGVEVTFRGSASLTAEATAESWAASAMVLAYLDKDGQTLGETMICVQTHYCPWENSPSLHIIPTTAGEWTDHYLELDTELPNLPAIDPSDVAAIRVSLLAHVYYC